MCNRPISGDNIGKRIYWSDPNLNNMSNLTQICGYKPATRRLFQTSFLFPSAISVITGAQSLHHWFSFAQDDCYWFESTKIGFFPHIASC